MKKILSIFAAIFRPLARIPGLRKIVDSILTACFNFLLKWISGLLDRAMPQSEVAVSEPATQQPSISFS